MRRSLIRIVAAAAAAFALSRGAGAARDDGFETRLHKSPDGGQLPYRLLRPANYNRRKRYPLVIFLHGAGERGSDNRGQFWGTGARMLIKLGTPEIQAKYPCIVVAPQCPPGRQWVNSPWGKGSYSIDAVTVSDEMRMLLDAIDAVRKEFRIDPARLYVFGISMGGYGTWDIILRRPKMFAAAIPSSGGGDPSRAATVTDVGIWAFHGGMDYIVPVKGSRDMVAALRKAGGKPKYTEYAGVGHAAWEKAYEEPDFLAWLFSQERADVRAREKEKADATARKKRRPKPKPRRKAKTLAPATVAKWDRRLLAAVRAATGAGRRPRFRLKSMGEKVEVLSVGRSGTLKVSASGLTMGIPFSRLTVADKKGLAVSICRARDAQTNALAAFYLLAAGDKARAGRYLRLAGDLAEKVRAAFK